MSYHFLLDLALILLSTKILGLIAQKFQMPQVVGALIAGLLLSPAGLGLLSETEFTKQLSELGVIVLMFSAGMGTDVNELKHSGKAGFMVAVLGVIVPFLMGTALAWGADELGLIESTGFIENIFIGTILTATSVSITVETLKEMKKLETKVGNTILAAALIDDVLGLIALTLVCSLAGGDESIGMVLLKIVGFFVFAFVVGFGANRIFCWMLKRQHGWASHRNSVFAFVLCLVMAYCAEKFFGVADITGAYAAGLAVACTPKGTYIQTKYNPLGYLLLTPVFFASIGINVQITGLTGGMVVFSILLLLVSIISKLHRLRPWRQGVPVHHAREHPGRRGHGLPRRSRADRRQPRPFDGCAVARDDDAGRHHGRMRHDPDADYAQAVLPRPSGDGAGAEQHRRPHGQAPSARYHHAAAFAAG